jgi:hypothetical protein
VRPTAALLALFAALALAACDSGDDGGDTTSSAAGGPGEAMEATIPAQIDEDPHGFVSTDVLHPLENAWRAGSAESFTEVGAGALAQDPSTGALAIFRHDYIAVTQETNLVEVPDGGALEIVDAPTGEDVAESAQEDGEIVFETEDGSRGTLDLSDDSVELE